MKIILVWVCKYIYGIGIIVKFNCFFYLEFKKIKENDKEFCIDIFSVYVCMGDIVDVGKL